jgi:hypothetical protein
VTYVKLRINPIIGSTTINRCIHLLPRRRRACARMAAVNYLEKHLLLFGTPSIIIFLSFLVVHTRGCMRTSNQHWSPEDYWPVLK